MSKNPHGTFNQGQGAETTEEIIGVLTAISVISKRMAKKLALLEQRSAEEEGEKKYEKQSTMSPHAD